MVINIMFRPFYSKLNSDTYFFLSFFHEKHKCGKIYTSKQKYFHLRLTVPRGDALDLCCALKILISKSMVVHCILSDSELWNWALDGGLHNLWCSSITTVHPEWRPTKFVLGLHQHADCKLLKDRKKELMLDHKCSQKWFFFFFGMQRDGAIFLQHCEKSLYHVIFDLIWRISEVGVQLAALCPFKFSWWSTVTLAVMKLHGSSVPAMHKADYYEWGGHFVVLAQI